MAERTRLLLALAIAFGLLALVPLLAQATGDPALVSLFTRMMIYGIAAISLDIILGYGGLVSFGHAAFFGLGGYTVGILFYQWRAEEAFLGLIPGSINFFVTIPAAMLVAGLGALIIGALSLRTTGVQFIMITLAFAQMLFFLFVSLEVYGGDDGMNVRRRGEIPFIDTRDNVTFFYVVLACLALFLFACYRIVGSRFGVLLEGVRQNERRLAAIGVSTYSYKLAAFVIAGMGAGLAGALMVNQARFVSPDMMNWTKSGELMIMVILGGSGTVFGPLLGAIVLVGLEDVLGQLPSIGEHKLIIIGPILILIVLFARRGLYGWLIGGRSGGGGGGHG